MFHQSSSPLASRRSATNTPASAAPVNQLTRRGVERKSDRFTNQQVPYSNHSSERSARYIGHVHTLDNRSLAHHLVPSERTRLLKEFGGGEEILLIFLWLLDLALVRACVRHLVHSEIYESNIWRLLSENTADEDNER